MKLKTINSNGGLVGKIKVLITRVYPMLYREKTPMGESSKLHIYNNFKVINYILKSCVS